MSPIVIIPLFVALFIGLAVFSHLQEKKRREAMAALAQRLGLRFSPDKDRALAGRLAFLERMHSGSNRYAHNVLSGSFRDHPVTVFDYHYETHSTDSKGRRQTHHHRLSFFVLSLPRAFPELTIAREGLFSKIAQAVGFDDIDFESHEFSRAFCVRSRDKKFAYDVCNAQMIEYLLANRDLNVELEQDALAIAFSSRLAPERVEPNLQRLIRLRNLMPDYLFAS